MPIFEDHFCMAASKVKIIFSIRFCAMFTKSSHVAGGIFPVVFHVVYEMMNVAEMMKQPLERLD